MQTDRTITDLFPEGVPRDGRSVLFTAPTPRAMGALPRRVLASRLGTDEAVVAASTRAPAPTVERSLATAGLSGPAGVVDCTPKPGTVADAPGQLRYAVQSPADLTGTSIALEKALDGLAARSPASRHLYYDSLSAPLNAVDADTVGRFADHAGRMVDGVAVFVAHGSVLGERELARLKTGMDAAVELRRRNGRREARCRRLPGAPTDWTAVEAGDGATGVAPSD
jgi:hypothetical protein